MGKASSWGMGAVFGWMGVAVAATGAYLTITSDQYDPSHLHKGTCTALSPSHRVVYGNQALSYSGEKQRASNSEESPDLTPRWEVNIGTRFTPQELMLTGASLSEMQPRNLDVVRVLSEGWMLGSLQQQYDQMVAGMALGVAGECYNLQGQQE